jgi:pimeloyl-ACP methyl ester carboxylesterase
MAYDERTKLEALRDQFETFGKGANYLLVGHSAGLIGCLSIVKDHPDLPPPLHRVGLLILLFGGGLLLGSLFWATSMMIKIDVTQAIISQQRPSTKGLQWFRSKTLEWVSLLGLWGSWAVFVIAIVSIMYQFRDAIPFEFLGAWRLSIQGI